MSDTAPVLIAQSISKSFLAHRVLDGVDVEFRRGEVHALLGENGAGKSTLIKILTGAYSADAGKIVVDGAHVMPRDTKHAQQLGIGTVYQEVNLLPNLTVAENLYVGRQPIRFGFVDSRRMENQSRQLLARYGLGAIDVAADLGTYSIAVQQIIAIARAVDISGKVLILDEPTASLDTHEVELLFGVVRSLRDQGLAIVFITHFLDQVFALADRVTVLRNGKLIGTKPIGELDRISVVTMMLGMALKEEEEARRSDSTAATGEVFAAFRGYGLRGKVSPFDLDIRRGEVVGVAGLLGSGRTESARLLFGIDRPDSGTATVKGVPARIGQSSDAIRLGFGFCPEDRKTDGIVGDLTVRENIVLALQGRQGWLRPLSPQAQQEIADRFVAALDIRTQGIEQPVKFLSGGNQQKVILARWLATQPEFLILDEPTRGIDVGAHAEIIKLINRLCDEGMSLLVISSEIEEIVAYATRVVVLRDRRIVGELDSHDISQSAIMRTIAGQVAA